MRILTWNINSVRLRMPQIQQMDQLVQADILCLQETKVIDDLFPGQQFHQMGFVHQAFTGMKSYNGVAILSRRPLSGVQVYNRVGRTDCRHISAVIDGLEVHNCYIPAGGDIPDRLVNEKFGHKLDFIDELTSWFARSGIAERQGIFLGDFNIAPLEHDVWSHKQLLQVVSHTRIEIEKMKVLQDSAAWIDAVRKFYPEPQKLYSWWSYRSPDWDISDRGRRLDHIWVTRRLDEKILAASILRELRGWLQPSDHVPVFVDLAE